jgi:hypothetical protein
MMFSSTVAFFRGFQLFLPMLVRNRQQIGQSKNLIKIQHIDQQQFRENQIGCGTIFAITPLSSWRVN